MTVRTSDLKTLAAVIEQRRRREDQLSGELARARADLESAVAEEQRAVAAAESCAAAVDGSDALASQELDQGAAVSEISRRMTFRSRLVVELRAAREVAGCAAEGRAQAEEALQVIQRKLAALCAKRVAAEQQLAEARKEQNRRAEERMDEEAADRAAALPDGEEGQ